MQTIPVDSLTFVFKDNWKVSKIDEWSYYRNQFQKVCGGAKAVDLLVVDQNNCAWLIEAKDYRQHRRTKTIDIAEEVSCKVRDSLAGMFACHVYSNDAEKGLARAAFNANKFRIVLHLEQPSRHSKMFPRSIDPAQVKQKLKQLIKPIDPHPLVLEMSNMRNVAWSVS